MYVLLCHHVHGRVPVLNLSTTIGGSILRIIKAIVIWLRFRGIPTEGFLLFL